LCRLLSKLAVSVYGYGQRLLTKLQKRNKKLKIRKAVKTVIVLFKIRYPNRVESKIEAVYKLAMGLC
jgi:hypothetical protein